MAHTARPYVLHEATLAQLQKLRPNVAIQPWGAQEGHNFHLAHGSDCIQASAMAEAAAQRANANGARCLVLPCMPYGNDNLQLDQVATITMKTATQHAVLSDIAESLVRQKIDRLIVLNGHGGNHFTAMIRDIMLALPIFIIQIDPYSVAPGCMSVLDKDEGDHANEMETALEMHLKPDWVAPMETAADGATTPSKLPKLSANPGVWMPRHWASLSKSTGVGDPRKATPEKGRHIFEAIVAALAPLFEELSNAKLGDFPYVIAGGPIK